MSNSMSKTLKLVLYFLFLSTSTLPIHAQLFSAEDIPNTGNLSTTWYTTVNPMTTFRMSNANDTLMIPIILDNFHLVGGSNIGLGFFSNSTSNNPAFFLVVYAIPVNTSSYRDIRENIGSMNSSMPKVLWTANTNKPVGANATLEFTDEGDLVLREGDGSLVWSTNTSGKSVVGMRIIGAGNLVLHTSRNMTVWSSFDYFTDTWLPDQIFTPGKRIVASVSLYNSTWTTGRYYLSFDMDGGFNAYIESNPLDSEFNAKLSDFGLARFIDKDQSQVLTTLRGTRGYLAPEWILNRRISEKVDVYSFGIVLLEIMCGRKNLDYSQPELDDSLVHLVKTKVEEDQLFDVVDKQNEDMMQHKEESIKMIRTAIWCLQGDSNKRPSMSMVVKVLEGDTEMENISDYSFLTLIPAELPKRFNISTSAPPLPSLLSGPR